MMMYAYGTMMSVWCMTKQHEEHVLYCVQLAARTVYKYLVIPREVLWFAELRYLCLSKTLMSQVRY